MKKILVTAATGHLGKAVVEFLLTRVPTGSISVLVRDAAKGEELKAKGVTLVKGDYSDSASLAAAFKGVDTLLFISSGTLEDRVGQHRNVIAAARACGVKHVIYTSVLRANEQTKFTPGIDHYHTEQALKAAGIPYTIFRNTFYAEVLPMLLGDALTSGLWFYAAGNARLNVASRGDMAEALANVLAAPAEHVNKVYEITSAKAYTFEEIATALSPIAGKTVTYTAISVDALRDGLVKAGVPAPYIPMSIGIAEAIAGNEFDVTDRALETLLKRKPADLAEYLPKVLKG